MFRFPKNFKRSKSLPNHPYRLKQQKKPAIPEKPKTYEVVLLDENEEKMDKLRLREELILENFYLDVKSDDNEQIIRENLNNLFSKKFPLITPRMFNFMKCCRTVLTDPGVSDSFEWDFRHLKSLAGQRKLYVQLIVPSSLIFGLDELDSHSSESSESVLQGAQNEVLSESSSELHVQTGNNVNVSSSSSSELSSGSTFSASLPGISYNVGGLTPSNDFEQLVNDLLDADKLNTHPLCNNLEESLSTLQKQMLNDSPNRLRVEAEYILTDALAYYKRFDFNACYPLRITYKSQAGVDAGGVKHQFYSDLFCAFENGAEGLSALFIGRVGAKVLAYNPVIVGSD